MKVFFAILALFSMLSCINATSFVGSDELIEKKAPLPEKPELPSVEGLELALKSNYESAIAELTSKYQEAVASWQSTPTLKVAPKPEKEKEKEKKKTYELPTFEIPTFEIPTVKEKP